MKKRFITVLYSNLLSTHADFRPLFYHFFIFLSVRPFIFKRHHLLRYCFYVRVLSVLCLLAEDSRGVF